MYTADIKKFMELIDVTSGREDNRKVFSDFVALMAVTISNTFDPIHFSQRADEAQRILGAYTESDQQKLLHFQPTLAKMYADQFNIGYFPSILTQASIELKLMQESEEPTTPDVCKLMANLAMGGGDQWSKENLNRIISQKGYIAVSDCAAGSGSTLLGVVEKVHGNGINYCQNLVMMATEIKSHLARQCYVQLSLYGVPAVVIHGNTLTTEEYDRWYTPAYIMGKWVWRQPMGIVSKRNRSDELLKMHQEPMYREIRRMQGWFQDNPMDEGSDEPA